MTRLNELMALLRGTRVHDLDQTDVCIQLMREYLRREALWAASLGIMEELPFANLPLAVNPKISPVAAYEEMSRAFARSPVEDRCCLYMLHWYEMEQQSPGVIRKWALPDPYAPLMAYFKNGGYFTTEHRIFVDVNQETGIHSGMVQHGDLTTPFADIDD